MSTKINKIKNWHKTLIVIVIVLAALAVGYFAKLYPVAIVNGNFVSYRVWDHYFSLAQKFDPAISKQSAFNQFIINKQKEKLVVKLGLGRNNSFEDELVFYKTGNEDQYKKLLHDYFSDDEKLFVAIVIESNTFDALLKIKYNSNFADNNNSYNKALNILAKLSQGQKFEDLAKQYSEDKISGQLGGDVGFVSLNQVLPELKGALEKSTLGEVNKNILVSRQGYHILYPIEIGTKDGLKVWHLKQILIQTAGYESWLKPQLQALGTHELMKL